MLPLVKWEISKCDKIPLMRIIEQKMEKIIQTIPDQPQNLIASDRFIVLSLLKNTLKDNLPKKPAFENTSFRNNLRTPIPTLTLNLRRVYPLNDFLLHFLEATATMGITNPILCREGADIYNSAIQYERHLAGDFLEEGSKKWFKREWDDHRRYLTQQDTKIVEYIDPEEAYYQVGRSGYNPKRFINVERNSRAITFQPKKEKIGPLPPTLILEAYLLYLLHTGNVQEKT